MKQMLKHLSYGIAVTLCATHLAIANQHISSPLIQTAKKAPKDHIANHHKTPAASLNLLSAYLAAKNQDMTYQSAEATYLANRYLVPIAFANLLPVVTIQGGYSWNKARTNHSHGTNYTITADQTLFNFGAWKAISLADATVKSETVKFTLAAQTLIHHLANAYFTVLLDQDQLRYAQQNELALNKQYQQIKAQYAVGTKAQADLQSAKASLEAAKASHIAAVNQLANDQEKLTVITNLHDQALAHLKSNIIFPKPQGNEKYWIHYGLQHNLNLIIAKMTAKTAKATIYAVYGGADEAEGVPGYLPTIGAQAKVAGQNLHGDQGNNPFTSDTNTQSLGLNLSWNLYHGGVTENTIKQDQLSYKASLDNVQEAKRETISSIKQDYRNVFSNLAQLKAYKQAIDATQVALNATRAGYNAGTRTIVDLLTEQSNLFEAQQNYATAVNQYILDSLQLKADAGSLNINDIKQLNDWLK